MKTNRCIKKLVSATLAASMVMGGTIPAMADEAGNYTVETTADGWIKVTNENGAVLGYSESSGVKLLEDGGYAFKDMNKNGTLDVYEDWRLDYDTRAQDLVEQATIEELSGLFYVVTPKDLVGAISTELTDGVIASLEQGYKGYGIFSWMAPTKTLTTWINKVEEYSEASSLGIPIEFTEDRVFSELGWSSPLGLAASFDPELAAEVGKIQSEEDRLVGRNVTMGLQMDLATEPRWSRALSTLGEDPALATDMAVAHVNAQQSTYDEEGNDLGWGSDSVIAQIKHFPGDGTGEGGRESHNDLGKYAVYPGGQFYTHLMPFKAVMDLPGATEQAASVMPSYSIAYSDSGEYGELVGTSFSEFKINNVLRENMGFTGFTSSDWRSATERIWGVEDLEPAERVLRYWEAGGDQLGGESDLQMFYDAYQLGCDKYGEEEFRNRINESAKRIITGFMKVQMFENPYLDTAKAEEVIDGDLHHEEKLNQNLKSVVMLKNAGNVIHDTTGEDVEIATVYVPMVYRDGEWKLPIDETVASEYINIVTDKVSETPTGEPDDEGNVTQSEADIIRAGKDELAECDYALAMIDSPITAYGDGYNADTEEYVPISLQYLPYTADSEFVRKEALANGEKEVTEETYYGPMSVIEKENRSYFGKSTTTKNATDLEAVLYAKENIPEAAPVIVAVNATNPVVMSEFEEQADAIVMGFSTSDEAMLQVVTGKVEPSGLLPLQMPASMETVEEQLEDVPRDMECYVDSEGNTYDFAYGLNWSGVISDERTEKYSVAPLVGEAF